MEDHDIMGPLGQEKILSNTAIHYYYHAGTGEIFIHPDVSLCCKFMPHKSSVGVQTDNHFLKKLPVATVAYPWFLKDPNKLEDASALTLAAITLATAWISPFVSFKKGTFKNFLYQIQQAVLVTSVVTVVHPIYILVYTFKKIL